jgi:hypothetical protein
MDVEMIKFSPARGGNAMHAAGGGEGNVAVPSGIDNAVNDFSIVTTPLGNAANLGTGRWRGACAGWRRDIHGDTIRQE